MVCSFCNKEINSQEIVCPHCGNHITMPDEQDDEAFIMTQVVDVPRKWVMFSAVCLLIAGSLLPWGKIVSSQGTIVIRGTDGDGILTLAIGGILLMAALLSVRRSQIQRFLFIAGGFFSALILFPKFSYLRSILKNAPAGTHSNIGIGLILANFAAILILVSAFVTKKAAVPIKE